ncbi:MAG: Crp/Fnr family transcriptional regulator [Chloroflexota bacterium]|nr:Crp/Fnr family transcriptional regulator [Chloroflexota bacterium]MDE2868969.1 Crp/Fnr family transcriptional regulator [Chloroflexota bacterium]
MSPPTRSPGLRLVDRLRTEGARPATYRAGQVVLEPASDLRRVGIVCNGSVTVWRVSPKGRQLAAASLREGDWFENVFPTDSQERTIVEADGPVTVAWLDIPAFRRLAQRHPQILHDMIQRQLSRLAAVQQRAAQTALDTVAGSVALAILQMAEQEHATDLRVTHEELALRLGTVRESVSLAINKLRRAGALAPASGRKRLISILSLPKLQQLAGARPEAH